MFVYITCLAFVSVTRVEGRACPEECAFYSLLKKQPSFLSINTCPCQGYPQHTSFLETQGRPASVWTEDSGWPGVALSVVMGTFQARWPMSQKETQFDFHWVPTSWPCPLTRANSQHPVSLSPSPSPTSDLSPPHPPAPSGTEGPGCGAASQWESLRNNLIASNYKQPRSPRSSGCQIQQNVSSSPRGRKEQFCSSNKTRKDFPDRGAVS